MPARPAAAKIALVQVIDLRQYVPGAGRIRSAWQWRIEIFGVPEKHHLRKRMCIFLRPCNARQDGRMAQVPVFVELTAPLNTFSHSIHF
jgi:hypothetical protein